MDGETCRSPRRVLRDQLAHSAEGAFFAARRCAFTAMVSLSYPLEAVRDDDHLLAAFK